SLAKRTAAAALPELWLGYAQYLFEDQQSQQSLDAINRASILLPESSKVRFWRARVLMSLGHMEEAEKDAQKAIALSPELPNAHNLLMKIYRARGLDNEENEQARWLAGHTTAHKAGSQ
ncbi:MAG: tetratricopeptide repeat protein, partial [Bryobacteraceae bacterium]